MTLHQKCLIVIIAIFSASSTIAENLTSCKTGDSAKFVRYAFGFSESSPIRLSCSENGEIQIGGFQVQNITERSILVKLPAVCNFSVSVSELFGGNYWPTNRNSLLLNCTQQRIPCAILANFSQILPENCGIRRSNPSCFTKTNETGFLPRLEDKCQFLWSSAFVDSTSNQTASLQFQVIELEWWLSVASNDSAKCSKNADPEFINAPRNHQGFRCRCKEGFEGNGYDGVGCRKGESLSQLGGYI